MQFFKSLIWLNLWFNPSLLDHWWTLYPLCQQDMMKTDPDPRYNFPCVEDSFIGNNFLHDVLAWSSHFWKQRNGCHILLLYSFNLSLSGRRLAVGKSYFLFVNITCTETVILEFLPWSYVRFSLDDGNGWLKTTSFIF